LDFLKLVSLFYVDASVVFISKYCEKWKLVVNVNKTEVMECRKYARLQGI